jgi:hypothetical protein
MYKNTSNNYTKRYYRYILNDTIHVFQKMRINNPLPIYNNILSQLLDIKENVVEKKQFVNPEEIDERYSLGGIAAKYFEENEELRERLFEVFCGACDYNLFLD